MSGEELVLTPLHEPRPTFLFPLTLTLLFYEFFLPSGREGDPFSYLNRSDTKRGQKETAHDIRAGLTESRELLHIPAKGKQRSCSIKDCFARSAEVWDQTVSWMY